MEDLRPQHTRAEPSAPLVVPTRPTPHGPAPVQPGGDGRTPAPSPGISGPASGERLFHRVPQGPDGAMAHPDGTLSAFRGVPGRMSAPPSLSLLRSRDTALVRMTQRLTETYATCNPDFDYSLTHNPRRPITKPSNGVGNDGWDNENADLIMHIHDVLVSNKGNRYVVLDLLGQGTFGQVAKCLREDLKDRFFAVKVIKNRPAYYHQAGVEIGIVQMLNRDCDPNDQHHIVRLLDYFVCRRHLCLVFELLNINLYELIRQNQFRGLSMNLQRHFLTQILDALTVLRDNGIVHCDLKPENILLTDLESGEIKVIDYGSACFENRTVYSYIQSRFYRSPEVLLGFPYNAAIDMWSLGCVAAELFLGLPLFPGESEYNLLQRIVETLGTPPDHMVATSTGGRKYFTRISNTPVVDAQGTPTCFRMLTIPEFERQENCKVSTGKRYFKFTKLEDIISTAACRPDLSEAELLSERTQRACLLDFLRGVMRLDPISRWTPRQAAQHPFVTGAPFVIGQEFVPPPDPKVAPHPATSTLPPSTASPQNAQGGGINIPAPTLPTLSPYGTPQQHMGGNAASFTGAMDHLSLGLHMQLSPPNLGMMAGGHASSLPHPHALGQHHAQQVLSASLNPQYAAVAAAASLGTLGGLQQQLLNANATGYGLNLATSEQLLAFQQQQALFGQQQQHHHHHLSAMYSAAISQGAAAQNPAAMASIGLGFQHQQHLQQQYIQHQQQLSMSLNSYEQTYGRAAAAAMLSMYESQHASEAPVPPAPAMGFMPVGSLGSIPAPLRTVMEGEGGGVNNGESFLTAAADSSTNMEEDQDWNPLYSDEQLLDSPTPPFQSSQQLQYDNQPSAHGAQGMPPTLPMAINPNQAARLPANQQQQQAEYMQQPHNSYSGNLHRPTALTAAGLTPPGFGGAHGYGHVGGTANHVSGIFSHSSLPTHLGGGGNGQVYNPLQPYPNPTAANYNLLLQQTQALSSAAAMGLAQPSLNSLMFPPSSHAAANAAAAAAYAAVNQQIGLGMQPQHPG